MRNLCLAPSSLSSSSIVHALGHLADRFALEVVDECDSTNSVLRDAPPKNDGRLPVLIARHQHAGRGRRGRSWQAWPGLSLTFSLFWRFTSSAGHPQRAREDASSEPPAPPSSAPPAGLSLVVGLAVAQALDRVGLNGVQLKWPNDVLVRGNKLAGILVELLPGRERGTAAAVIGIGLNLGLPAATCLPYPASVTALSHELAAPPDSNTLTAVLLTALHDMLIQYAQRGFTALRPAWQAYHAFDQLPVKLQDDQTTIAGICAGVDEDGALLLDTRQGRMRILAGDVSLRPDA